jgi:hypothetical protein
MIVVLDPTGMQYGWKEHISLWSTYEEHRVHWIGESMVLGPGCTGIQHSENHEGVAELVQRGFISPDRHSEDCEEQRLMETVVLSLHSQIKARFGGVNPFLQLKGADYAAAAAAFTAAAKRVLTMLAGEINNGAEIKIIGPPSTDGNANTGQGCNQTEIIWSSE